MKVQRGVSLIEMMVSLAIGLVLILGVSTVFLSMRQTANLTTRMSSVANNERIAMMFLNTNIRGAGFFQNPPLDNNAFTLFPASAPFIVGQSLTGTGANTGADTISVRFQANGVAANQGCSAQLNAGDVYLDVFSVTGGYLTCTETNITAATAAVTVNLVAGLSGINILYGVDTTSSGSVTEYLTGTQVESQNLWYGVKTVNVRLIFSSALAGQEGRAVNATRSLEQSIIYMNGR